MVTLSFKYLGLALEANPCREMTCQPMINLISKKLGLWNKRFVSLEVRVVTVELYSQFHSLFLLVLHKMTVKVYKWIVSLQRHFMWGWGLRVVRNYPM